MKNKGFIVFILSMLLSLTLLSQPYTKGDLLLSLNAGIIKIVKNENPDLTWQGTPVSTSIEFMLLNKDRLTLGVGLGATYFRHQLNSSNYGVMGLGVPVSLHYSFLPSTTAYVGYMPGWYFDGYKPEGENVNSGYGGLYSEMFLGVRYFVFSRLAILTEISTSDFMVKLGVSMKL